jgi:endoglucanase
LNFQETLFFILCLLHCGILSQAQTGPDGKSGPVKIPLRHAFGVNAFEWDFENEKDPAKIDSQRLDGMKSFTAIRHYMDWEKLEHEEGRYSFNPTLSGGWNYDALYESCKANGIDVLACLKTIPKWLVATYPAEEKADQDNVPVRHGMDFADPRSYIEQAKVAFQYAARYGGNSAVDDSVLSVDNRPRWTNDQVNVVKKGLGLIRYIECDNERDKWWKGPKAYQSGRNYAANLSAFYDGHKNTMGPGVGVKNADPAMKVVMGGLAKPDTAYVIEMIKWCRENRGYHPDGSVNLCWDVINYHLYSDDDESTQGLKATRGMAPEKSAADSIANNFMKMAREHAGGMPVWMTETGYDVDQRSPLKAIRIGHKTALETQADWILRSALLYMRHGIARVFLYQTYDENTESGGRFSSSGLLNKNHSRKPAADYIYQTNKLMGRYSYKAAISISPLVDQYELNNKYAYVLVKPSENGSSVTYTLSLKGTKQAYIYHPAAGKEEMNKTKVEVINGKLPLLVSETPVFIIPAN